MWATAASFVKQPLKTIDNAFACFSVPVVVVSKDVVAIPFLEGLPDFVHFSLKLRKTTLLLEYR